MIGSLEQALAGSFRATEDALALDCNPAFARILGCASRADVLGRRLTDFHVGPGQWDRLLVHLRRDGAPRALELPVRDQAGIERDVVVSARRTDGTATSRIEAVVIDITDLRRQETTARQAEALRLVSALGRAIAHEINNPLVPLMLSLDSLARTTGDQPASQSWVESAINAATRIRDVVARVGRIARLEMDDASPRLPAFLDLRRSSDFPDTG